MKYFLAYLAIGAILFLGVVIRSWLSGKSKQKNRENGRWHISASLGQWLALAITVVSLWPIGLLLTFTSWRSMRSNKSISDGKINEKETQLSISTVDLRREISVAEIEQAEMVGDPMGAVPNVPFGHLNPAWRAFQEQLKPDDKIWAFATQWTRRWGAEQIWEGYVILRAGEIGPYLVTSIDVVDREAVYRNRK